ncbi:deoxyribodipyrimidine photo-lyase [Panacibacter ginsenosidivorans]|uniref:Deoxyribodipyrimidine photo-lyase n=1 Tax=Panacibacter ginsenosidivorans TaxID=1813871 RepID=A0A5B8V663_9BACT|nr:deoxyribodipyrimidine photo-lyase [Panacibacter ginsenosidivorans]QEC66585.1 deoxyribodipyrimidine photo-lyase [Panacibacter ginsenosidivorans]
MTVNIMWFRRDLRLHDNAALYHALKSEHPVIPVFIFDKNILDDLEEKKDRRVEFIREALLEMQEILKKHNSSLEVYYDTPLDVYKKLVKKYTIKTVFANEDYEQYAMDRDDAINKLLNQHNAELKTYKDHVILAKEEVLKDDGKPYTVFTPYSKKWKAILTGFHLKPYPTEKYSKNFFNSEPHKIPSLESMGFIKVGEPFPPAAVRAEIIKHYKEQRNYPGIHGTTKLGVHLRFGTISIRELAGKVKKISETYLNELIWRDFYHMILWHFPHVRKEKAFKPEYDHIHWRNNEKEFNAWCNGQTGYPIVDAGMRELNATGYMHNRVRMIVASFLTKHLLIDWRWGEAYFAKKLLDYDYAANNGGWQWAAGSGCDAAPYFRVFNPTLQTQKFDADLKYIRKWVPEFEGFDYVKPIVDQDMARKRAIEVYSNAVKKS